MKTIFPYEVRTFCISLRLVSFSRFSSPLSFLPFFTHPRFSRSSLPSFLSFALTLSSSRFSVRISSLCSSLFRYPVHSPALGTLAIPRICDPRISCRSSKSTFASRPPYREARSHHFTTLYSTNSNLLAMSQFL